MEQINPRELEAFMKMKEAAAANAAISQSDGVVIRQAQGNVPGAYVSAEQKLQDSFAQQVAMNNVPGLYGQSDNAGYYGNHERRLKQRGPWGVCQHRPRRKVYLAPEPVRNFNVQNGHADQRRTGGRDHDGHQRSRHELDLLGSERLP